MRELQTKHNISLYFSMQAQCKLRKEVIANISSRFEHVNKKVKQNISSYSVMRTNHKLRDMNHSNISTEFKHEKKIKDLRTSISSQITR